MTEISRPWSGTTIGDAGPYTPPNWWDVWQAMMGGSGALSGVGNRGIFLDIGNKLEVTYVGPNFLSVDTGAALIDGLFYNNDAAKSVTVTSATAGNVRDDRLVVRKYFASDNQTARIVLLAGTQQASPGPGTPPALTQDTARLTYWDIPLARVSITDGGVITLTDERDYIAGPSGAMVLLATHEVTDPAGEAYFDFDNISQVYGDLRIVYTAGTNEILAYGGLEMSFNDDVEDAHYAHAVNYYSLETDGFEYSYYFNTGPYYVELGGACRSDMWAIGRVVSGEIYLPDYSLLTQHSGWGKSTQYNGEHALYNGWWDTQYAAAIPYAGISKIRIGVDFSGGHKLAQGSIFRLYGIVK